MRAEARRAEAKNSSKGTPDSTLGAEKEPWSVRKLTASNSIK
jgi:hypothetical protein